MLFVLFKLGEDRYALDASSIVEVLPLVEMRHLPHAAPGIAGIFNYRGTAVPVVDLSDLAYGRPATHLLSTRIVLTNYVDAADASHVLGLIAEGATETMRRERSDFAAFGIGNGSARYLGPVTRDARGFVQWIDVNRLLSSPIRALLSEKVSTP